MLSQVLQETKDKQHNGRQINIFKIEFSVIATKNKMLSAKKKIAEFFDS